jgi:hypothetical protein
VVNKSLKVGILQWKAGGGISQGITQSLHSLGHEPVEIFQENPLPDGLELVIAYGPFGSLVPLCQQLLDIPPGRRPAFAFIMTEQLPRPDLPEWFRYPVGKARSWAERVAFRKTSDQQWRVSPYLKGLLGKAARYRYYGDLFWMRNQGLLTVLAVWSYWTADFLRARGFDPLVLTGGFQQDWGRKLELERDIPVLWIGKPGSNRRARLIRSLREQLRERGVEMMVVDGQEQPFVFGEKRTVLLNRTKVVVNLLREKWDDNSMRYALASYNGALVVSEPTLPHTLHQPGIHLVTAPLDQLAGTICHYLEHEEERQRIVENAYQLLNGNRDPTHGIAAIIDKAFARRGLARER